MTSSSSPSAVASATVAAERRTGAWYAAVWRWHFYAGLLMLPFLVWLALTGAAFVFKPKIDAWAHSDLQAVPVRAEPARPPHVLVASALAAHPGTAFKYTPPARPTSSAEVGVATAEGRRQVVYVDPFDGRVLGMLADNGTLSWTLRRLHSLRWFGPVARGAIEIAAGWSLLLFATGLYLWWPRGRSGGVLTVRGTPQRRVFWRDLHAVTGVLAGGGLVFLAVTGLPWSGVWGAQVNAWANGTNFGYPAGMNVQVPMSTQRVAADTAVPWSLTQAQVPQSGAAGPVSMDHAAHGGEAAHVPPGPDAAAIGLDAAVSTFQRLGLAPGFTVVLPKGATGVYTGSVYPPELARQRVIHLDQYTGNVLVDLSYGNFGPLARWLEWGINVHLGQEFGVPNQALLLAVCAGIVLLCASAVVMWWKRRPAGRLGIPPAPAHRRTVRGLLALLAVGGIAFPLVGASLLVMAVLDQAVMRWRPAART